MLRTMNCYYFVVASVDLFSKCLRRVDDDDCSKTDCADGDGDADGDEGDDADGGDGIEEVVVAESNSRSHLLTMWLMLLLH